MFSASDKVRSKSGASQNVHDIDFPPRLRVQAPLLLVKFVGVELPYK